MKETLCRSGRRRIAGYASVRSTREKPAMAFALSLILAACAVSGGDGENPPQEPTFPGSRPESRSEAMAMPRNVIAMVGDGAAYNQLKAAAYYRNGEWPDPALESFTMRLACSTYPEGGSYDPVRAWTDFSYPPKNATDSAAAATAIATGRKTENGRIATDSTGNRLETILEAAERAGKLTGIVTSVPISHATPAAFASHAASRGSVGEIAESLVFYSALDVLIGCGNPERDDDGKPREDGALYDWIPKETWDALVAGTAANDRDGDGDRDAWVLARDSAEIASLGSAPDFSHVAAIPNVHSTLQQRRSGDALADAYAVPFTGGVPTLAELSAVALNLLSKGPDGFALMIEGGAIDWACHGNQSGRMIEEAGAFLDAVGAVIDWVDASGLTDDTLVIVVADHETGYLLGESGWPPFTAIGNNGKGRMPDMEWNITAHTNGLVPLFARGANAAHFANDIRGYDSRRGWFIDNADIGKRILAMLE